jgi:hypothetical protein
MIAKFTLFDRSSNWVGGTCGGYEFQAKLFDIGSEFGIGSERVSKLDIFTPHCHTVVHYERGWDMRPSTKKAKEALRGGYTDVTPNGEDVLTRGSIRFRPSHHQHYVRIPKEGALTILLCGPQSRNWGFWVKGNHLRPLRFFSRHGHPPSGEQ